MDIEFLDFEEDLELIEKINGKFKKYEFPVVYFKDKVCFFNSASAQLIPTNIKWSISPNYVVGLPGEPDDRNSFKIRKKGETTMGFFPSVLKNEKKLKAGYYKLYKYKDGFAFKRYELLEES